MLKYSNQEKMMFIRAGSIVVSVFLVIAAIWPALEIAASSPEQVNFETITIQDGLSHAQINAIQQDQYGYIWIGSRFGLNRYDGISFIKYLNDPQQPGAISNSNITVLYVTSDNTLLVGTYTGLNMFNRKDQTFVSYRHSTDNPDTISDDVVKAIYEDTHGNLWIGTDRGLDLFDRQAGTFCSYQRFANDSEVSSPSPVQVIYEDSLGGLWIGTADGLNRFDSDSKSYFNYSHDESDSLSISNNFITSIIEDSLGGLWIGTADGLNRFDRNNECFDRYVNDSENPESISNDYITAICAGEDGKLWIGTKRGLNNLDVTQGTFDSYYKEFKAFNSIANNEIRALCRDVDGNLWIGTYGGLNVIKAYKQTFSQTLVDRSIYNICSLDGRIIWLRTSEGLVKYDSIENKALQTWPHIFHEYEYTHIWISTFCIASDGTLWSGTQFGGLRRFDPQTGIITVYNQQESGNSIPSNTILALHADGEGNVWIGTDKGLCSFDVSSGIFEVYNDQTIYPDSISNGEVWGIYRTDEGHIWVSTITGLFRINHNGGAPQVMCMIDNTVLPGTFYNNIVRLMYQDSRGLFWAISGYRVYNNEPGSQKMTINAYMDQYMKTSIRSLVEDQSGNLWAASDIAGLIRLGWPDGTNVSYDNQSGLMSDSFYATSGVRAENGALFFGTSDGLITFMPEDIMIDTTAPQLLLTGFELIEGNLKLDQPVEEITEVELPYSDNSFYIEFIGINYTVPENNQYAYMLEGFDGTWQYTGAHETRIRYTNLKSGQYNFLVKAANGQGVWSNEVALLSVFIASPFWQQWWFILLAMTSVVALILGLIHIRERTMKHRNRELEACVEERTRQLFQRTEQLEAEINRRISFTRALVHELKTPLTPLLSSSEFLSGYIKEDIAQGFVASMRNGVLRLEKRINELMDSAKGEVGLVKLECNTINALNVIKEAVGYFVPQALRKHQNIITELPDSLPDLYADQDRIGQVIQNLLDNASKFTRKGGTITLRARQRNNHVEVEVEDSGCGINQEEKQYIFEPYSRLRHNWKGESGLGLGLHLSRVFIELHGGKIWFESDQGHGSRFVFSLPVYYRQSGENINDNGHNER